jgi:hypothetical protein
MGRVQEIGLPPPLVCNRYSTHCPNSEQKQDKFKFSAWFVLYKQHFSLTSHARIGKRPPAGRREVCLPSSSKPRKRLQAPRLLPGDESGSWVPNFRTRSRPNLRLSGYGQAEDALPKTGGGTAGENRQLSRSGNWAAVAFVVGCFSGPPPCSTEATCGRASRSRLAGTKPDRKMPNRAAPFPGHHTLHNGGELRAERFSALAQN